MKNYTLFPRTFSLRFLQPQRMHIFAVFLKNLSVLQLALCLEPESNFSLNKFIKIGIVISSFISILRERLKLNHVITRLTFLTFQDAPVTAYYLWLPFLLTFCFGFAKMPRSLWRNFLEGNMLRNIIQVGILPVDLAQRSHRGPMFKSCPNTVLTAEIFGVPIGAR